MTAKDIVLAVAGVTKTYASGHQALKPVDLEIRSGEIFALLGPNGAGKTTLISIICGIVTPSSGRISAFGMDIARDYRRVRQTIGLVPQELNVGEFESVHSAVTLTRGLFGLAPDRARVDQILRDLSLWDKRDTPIRELSGGMKRRLMIAKALAHEPRILFLDEPTAGVDVELRRDMWALVRGLKDKGVTIILTTHYIEEAEEMADRVGVITHGELILVEEKATLMDKMGKKTLTLDLSKPLDSIPASLASFGLTLADDGHRLVYEFDARSGGAGVATLLQALAHAGVSYKDLHTEQSSLEEIFVSLVTTRAGGVA